MSKEIEVHMNSPNYTECNAKAMLNLYPDSIGGTLVDIIKFLQMPELDNVFGSIYILPSLFNTDLDRGFSVIDYELNEIFASKEDLTVLDNMNIDLKLDFVLNHLSVLSEQFQDLIKKGDKSKYKDFFINWNEFWDGHGEMTDEGYIQPEDSLIKNMFYRKPGLPILFVRFPDGKEVPYWNTFYQERKYASIDVFDLVSEKNIQYATALKLAKFVNEEVRSGKEPKEIDFGQFMPYKERVIELLDTKRRYMGQMDLNINSPQVWDFYEETFRKLSHYGAKIARLDAFAYVSKKPGLKNFFNEPETWALLERIKSIADKYDIILLPEIHSKYEEKTHEKLAMKGYMIYDFFLPGLIIDAIERNTSEYLLKWFNELQEKKIKVVNMLGCHDGIPVLDLKGLLPDEHIDSMIDTIVNRGGHVKDLHGKEDMYYQVNATYYSALGENDKKLILARAIQMFMPGKPQIWYLDLFAGKNNYEAINKNNLAQHKEINRTNLTMEQVHSVLSKGVVKQQLSLLKFRNTFSAFGFSAESTIIESPDNILKIQWDNNGYCALLEANLESYEFIIKAIDKDGVVSFTQASDDK